MNISEMRVSFPPKNVKLKKSLGEKQLTKCSETCDVEEFENNEREGKWVICPDFGILVPNKEEFYCWKKEV